MRHEPIEEFECSFCGWAGNDACILDSSLGVCPSCGQKALHEVDVDPVNKTLAKAKAYMFAAMIASFCLGTIVGHLYYGGAN